jgi:CRISPR-associated protein Csd1
MLNEVIAWARQTDLAVPPGFKVKPVRWALVFGSDGEFKLVRELGDPEAKKKRGSHLLCPNLELGEIKRGGSGTRHFLVDNTQVVALLGADEDDEKIRAKHDFFVGLLAAAADVLSLLDPVAESLRGENTLEAIRSELEDRGASPTENATIEVRGANPDLLVEGDAWHGWYQRFRAGLQKESSQRRMRCLVSGELVEPVATHSKVIGLADVGGLSMGDVLPAFKQESFRSYGLEQAANAAMSEEAAASYTAALNRLIREQSERLAGTRILYWYQKPLADPEDDPFHWIVEPDERTEGAALERARQLLNAIQDGSRADLQGNRYFALTVSANSGRVMLRDWMQGSFAELVRNVSNWLEDLQVVSRDGARLNAPPKVWAVLGSLVRELKDLPDPLVTRMWRVAARNEPIPQQAAARALERFRVATLTDQPVRTAGVGLLKAFLRRHPTRGEDMTKALNETHPHAAYQCGRLMAVLAYLQYRALGDVGAGVVQRYYAAASVTPALVTGRLLRMAQFHLNKLEVPERLSFEHRIGQVMSQLKDGFPPPLSLEEQSLFALGYYHQKSYRPSKSEAEEPTEALGTDPSEEIA